MGIQLTEKQKSALMALANGPNLMPIVHFGKLRSTGLVENAEGGLRQKGYSFAALTDDGRAAITG